LDFKLFFTSDIVFQSVVEKLDHIIWELAIEILTQASIETKIHWFLYRIHINYYYFRFAAAILD
jgi:hypothetical protein